MFERRSRTVRPMKLSLERRVQFGFVVAIVLLLVAGVSTWWNANRTAADFQELTRLEAIIHQISESKEAIVRAQAESRGFLITGDQNYVHAFNRACRTATTSLEHAQIEARDDGFLRGQLRTIAGLVDAKIATMNEGIALRRTGTAPEVQAFVASGRGAELMEELQSAVSEADDAQDARLAAAFVATRKRATMVGAAGLAATLLAVVFVGIADVTVRRDRRRRRAAELELRAAAEHQREFVAIVESSDDAIISVTNAGLITSWNPGAEQLLGYPAADIIGREIGVLMPPDRRQEQMDILDRLACGEHLHDFETVRLHRDGRGIDVSATISALRDDAGKMLGVSAILRDISARKNIEEALRRSEESLAVTLSSIGDAVLATDTVGRVTRMNPVAEKLTGWIEAEAKGQPLSDVLRLIHEQTRAPANLAIEQVLTSGQIHGIANDAVLVAQDGTERPIADSAAPIRGAGGVILGLVIVFRDVTEERRAQTAIRDSEIRLRVLNEELERRVEERTAALREERLRYHTLFEQSPTGVALYDPASRRFLDFNSAAHRQLGYSREEFARLEIKDIEARETPAEIEQRSAHVAGAGFQKFETKHRARNGELRDMVVSLQMIQSGGRPVMYCLYEDITERRRAERLAQRAQRLESLGTLAGGIAHDLNNALAPISMGLELLALESSEDRRTLDLLRTSVKRGADMVRQLLTFARGSEGERVEIGPKQLLREIQAIVQATFPKNIELEVRYPADVPPMIGDPTQLHQILLNLSVNARDAMPHGGSLTLEAGCFEVDDVFAASVPDARPGRYVFLRVRDTGTGIPPDLIDRIFEPFFTTKGPDKGTGLGLSTVMGIVRGHRGFLQVTSEPGHGSTFTVYLPVNPSPAIGITVDTAPHRPAGAGQLILFVDDEPALREIARAVLQRLNFQVATARDGLDALMVATERKNELHAVITDLHMPHMDGSTFVRALRRMLPHVPVAIATGRADEVAVRDLQALGVTLRLDKPFTQAQLANLLNELISRPSNN